jgi:hypothetical protein
MQTGATVLNLPGVSLAVVVCLQVARTLYLAVEPWNSPGVKFAVTALAVILCDEIGKLAGVVVTSRGYVMNTTAARAAVALGRCVKAVVVLCAVQFLYALCEELASGWGLGDLAAAVVALSLLAIPIFGMPRILSAIVPTLCACDSPDCVVCQCKAIVMDTAVERKGRWSD